MVVESRSLPPSYIAAMVVKDAVRYIDNSGHVFPEKFRITPNRTNSTIKWVLGQSCHQPLYAISRREQPSGNKPDVILHDGVSLRDPALASFRCFQASPRTWKVRVPLSSAEPEAGFETVSAGNDWRAQKRPLLKFSFVTGVCHEREEFEWRSSNNGHIRGVLGGQSLGWKLVRVTQDVLSERLKGPRGTWPRTSDGAEVVAVFSSSDNTLADWHFAFLGTGARGVLGSHWEIMAVITSLILMDNGIRMSSEID
jgi:hypothetical protein